MRDFQVSASITRGQSSTLDVAQLMKDQFREVSASTSYGKLWVNLNPLLGCCFVFFPQMSAKRMSMVLNNSCKTLS